MEPVQFRFQQTEADLIAYNLLFLGHSTTYRRGTWISRLILPAIAMIISTHTLLVRPQGLPAAIVISVLAIIWFLVWPSYRNHLVMRQVTRMVRERSNAGILGEHDVTVDDHTICCDYPAGASDIRWSHIIDLREDDRLLLLYTSSLHALIFPKDRIAAAIIDRLRAQAQQVIGQKAVAA